MHHPLAIKIFQILVKSANAKNSKSGFCEVTLKSEVSDIKQPHEHVGLMGCLNDPANVQQTSSKCIQNTRANAGRLLDRVNTL